MRFILASLLIFSFVVFAANSAHACLCLPLKPRKALKEAKAVFIGKAVEVKRSEQKFTEFIVKFEVERYWKNVPGPYVTVVTAMPGGGSCGLRVVEGKSYLIFAYGEGRIETSICSARAVENATEELKKLGKGKAVEVIPPPPSPPSNNAMQPTAK